MMLPLLCAICVAHQPMNAANPGKFVQTTTAPSRGALTTNFLTGSMPPLEYLQVMLGPQYHPGH
jgi:hypothetical protein